MVQTLPTSARFFGPTGAVKSRRTGRTANDVSTAESVMPATAMRVLETSEPVTACRNGPTKTDARSNATQAINTKKLNQTVTGTPRRPSAVSVSDAFASTEASRSRMSTSRPATMTVVQ